MKHRCFLLGVLLVIIINSCQARDIDLIRAGPDDFCFVKHGMLRCLGRNQYAQFGIGTNQPVGLSQESYAESLPLPDFGLKYTANETVKDVCSTLKTLCVLTSTHRVRCVGEITGNGDNILGWGISATDAKKKFDFFCISNCGAHSTPDTVLPTLGVKPTKFICTERAIGLIYEDGTVLAWGSKYAVGRWEPYNTNFLDQTTYSSGVGSMGNNLKSSRDAGESFKDFSLSGEAGVAIGLYFNSSIHSYVNWKPHTSKIGNRQAVDAMVQGLPTGKSINHVTSSGYWVTQFSQTGGQTVVSDLYYPGPMAGAVTNDGDLYVWGSNAFGQLGIGTTYSDFRFYTNATKVDLIKPVKKAVMSPYTIRTCVIFTDETLSCWGYNQAGELGFNAPIDKTWGEKPEHMGANLPLIDLGVNRTVIDVVLGHRYTCALLTDDIIKCWGANDFGILGPSIRSAGVNGQGMGEDLPVVDTSITIVHDVSPYAYHICAKITTNGAIINTETNPPLIKCWGANFGGQIGQTPADPAAVGDRPLQMGNKLKFLNFGNTNKIPSQVVTPNGGLHYVSGALDRIWSATMVVFTDGTLKIISDFGIRSKALGATYYASGYGNHTDEYFPPERQAYIDLGTGFQVKRVASGSDSYCAASLTKVKCWGEGTGFPQGYPINYGAANGTMGDNLPSLIDITGSGVEIRDLVSFGYGFAVLLTNDTVLAFGSNHNGELLQGDITPKSSVVTAKLPSNLKIKSIHAENGMTCIVVDESFVTMNHTNLMCWGRDHPNPGVSQVGGASSVGGSSASLNQTWVEIKGNVSVKSVNPGSYFCVQFVNGSVSCLFKGLLFDSREVSATVQYAQPLGTDGKTSPIDLGFHCKVTKLFVGISPCFLCSNRLVCIGYGQFGRMGQGTTKNLLPQIGEVPKATNLFECPPGTSAPAEQAYCAACPRGEYSEVTIGVPKDSTACTKCPVGKYGIFTRSRSLAEGCLDCPIGKIAATPGSTSCVDCIPGKYAGATGLSTCQSCWPGSAAPSPGQQNCTLCLTGTFNNGNGLTGCSLCEPGKFQDTRGQTSCQGCTKGYFQAAFGQSNCTTCAPGSTSGQSASTCSQCQAGSFSNATGSTQCFGCIKGSFSAGAGSSSCSPCPAGFHAPSDNAIECIACNGGEFSAAGASACKQCTAGLFSGPSAVNCSQCPAGSTSGPGASSCSPCTPGSASSGANACSTCLKGTFAQGTGRTACESCPVGTFSASDGAQECTRCPGGTVASVAGSTTCTSCSAGKFAQAGAANCTACPSGSFQAASGQQECSRCPASTYSFAGASACSACPVGANCSTGVYNGPLPGFWHGAIAGGDGIPAKFYPCPFPESCQINNNSLVCQPGYTGSLCAECLPGYHLSSKGCITCSGETNTITTIVGVVLLVFSMAIMIFALYRAFNNVDGQMQAKVETGGKPPIAQAQNQSLIERLKAMTKIKVMVSFGQILASFNNTMDIAWPDQLKTFFGYFSSLNFNIFDVFSIDCAVRQNFFGNLVTVTLAPLILALIAFGIYRLLRPRLQAKLDKDPSYEPSFKTRAINNLANRFIKGGLFLLFLVYPGVSSTILRTWDCRNVEGKLLLTSDFSVSCEDADYTFWSLYAAVFALVYPIGIPLVFFLILYRNRERLQTDPDFKSRFGFLYESYEPQAWYYELTELIRKLVLTGVLIFLVPGTASQVVVGLLVCFLAIVLHANLQPFIEDVDDNLQSAALVQLFICLFAGLTLKTDVAAADGYDQTLLVGALVIMNSAVFILGTVAIAVTMFLSAKRAFSHTNHHEEMEKKSGQNMEMMEMDGNEEEEEEGVESEEEEHKDEDDKAGKTDVRDVKETKE